MANGIWGFSAGKGVLLGVVGVSAGLAAYYRNESENQRLRKNELALSEIKLGGNIVETQLSQDHVHGHSLSPRPSGWRFTNGIISRW